IAGSATGTFTVTDSITRNGCPGQCQDTVTVNQNPTCTITGPSPVCGSSTNIYTTTVLPAAGTVTHSWAITGDGTISGSTTGASVTVIAGSATGTFTVTDSITRNGCPGQCQDTVTVNENPTCTIAGPSPVCGGTTNTYTTTVQPAGGTVTHSWAITGDGTISGSITGASVTVIAGSATGTFTVTDSITRDGC